MFEPNLREPEEIENIFQGFDERARDLLTQCKDGDAMALFVDKFSRLLSKKIVTAQQMKDVVELLRGNFWLKFLADLRSNSKYDLANHLVEVKNELLEVSQNIGKSQDRTATGYNNLKAGASMPSGDDRRPLTR